MDDALAFGQKGEIGSRSKLTNVGIQRHDLFFAGGIGNAVVAQFPPRCGCVVVGSGHNGADAPDFSTRLAQTFKSLRAGDFMYEMAIYVQNGRAVFFGMDDVFVPEFVVECASHMVFLGNP